MSEKPNPSLDCASLVRFSAPPLYHGGELQSCWAVIRSSSLLQTPPPSPVCPPPSPTAPPQLLLICAPPPPIKKEMFIFFTFCYQGLPCRKSEKDERRNFKRNKKPLEKLGVGSKTRQTCWLKCRQKWLNMDWGSREASCGSNAIFQESFLELPRFRCVSVLILGSPVFPDQIIPNK